jgi:hypothetical protein
MEIKNEEYHELLVEKGTQHLHLKMSESLYRTDSLGTIPKPS